MRADGRSSLINEISKYVLLVDSTCSGGRSSTTYGRRVDVLGWYRDEAHILGGASHALKSCLYVAVSGVAREAV